MRISKLMAFRKAAFPAPVAVWMSLLLVQSMHGQAGPSTPTREAIHPVKAATRGVLASQYGKLPLRFEPNQGQSDKRVDLLSRGQG